MSFCVLCEGSAAKHSRSKIPARAPSGLHDSTLWYVGYPCVLFTASSWPPLPNLLIPDSLQKFLDFNIPVW
jgi:hypothetical protein